MAHLLNRAIRSVASPRQLNVSQKRFRSKINIQRPQKLFYQRAVVTELLTPIIPPPNPPVPIWEACQRVTRVRKVEQEEPHPYLRIIANECLQRYRDSKMTALFHRNSMTQEEEFEFAVKIHKYNMFLKSYGKNITKVAFADTEFEATLPLFGVSNLTVFSPEVNVGALLKCVKKVPQLVLMAGIIDGKLLSHNDFVKYGKTSLTDARSQLVHTLQMAGGINLNRQLNHHQGTLVSRLQQIANNEATNQDKVSDAQPSTSETVTSEEIKSE